MIRVINFDGSRMFLKNPLGFILLLQASLATAEANTNRSDAKSWWTLSKNYNYTFFSHKNQYYNKLQ